MLEANGHRARGVKRKRGHPIPKCHLTPTHCLSGRKGRKIFSQMRKRCVLDQISVTTPMKRLQNLQWCMTTTTLSKEFQSQTTFKKFWSQTTGRNRAQMTITVASDISDPITVASDLNGPITVVSVQNDPMTMASGSDADVLEHQRSLDFSTDAVYAVNTCGVVRYTDRCCPGVVVEDNIEHLIVDFLKPHGTKNKVFTKPAVPDVQTVSKEMVVAKDIVLVLCGNSFREWRVEGFSFS